MDRLTFASDDDPIKDSTGVIILKVCFIFFVFFLTIGSGMLPVKWPAFRNSPTVLGIANAFSGGLFLSIALFHVLPEVVD